MKDSIFSEHWYRVAQLKPALREHAAVFRHRYRNNDWWIIRDPVTNRQHRLSPAAHFLVVRMDGDQTVQAIWDHAIEALGEDAPTQSDLIELLGRLHNVDLLRTDVNPDAAELLRRYETRRKGRHRQSFVNPLFLRFSLLDPDRLLRRLLPLGHRLLTPTAFAAWGAIVLTALVLAYTHWEGLVHDAGSNILAPANLVVLWLVYPLMKLLHELGHGLAVKRWGGEVHDTGIMLMVMLPVPYIDASASAAFPDKRKRMIVGAIGIMIEALLAALALFVWLVIEPGLVRQVAFDIMLIGGVSTVFFNGNPLLRFDGYYVLADWIEIPNLAGRSKRYLSYLVQTSLLGVTDRVSPAESRGEAAWFVCYGVASFVYRVLVLFVIAFYLGTTLLIAGVLLAMWVLFTQLAVPFAKSVSSLVRLSQTPRQRLRIYGITAVAFGAVWTLLFSLPLPSTTAAEGVLWLTDRSVVRAGTDCFVVETLQNSGSYVHAGAALANCTDPELLAKADVLKARIETLQREYRGFALREQVKRKILVDEIAALAAERDLTKGRIDALTIRSEVAGTFIIPDNTRLEGRFFGQGDTLGFVMSESAMTIRTAVTQGRVGLIRDGTDVVDVRFASVPNRAYRTSISRHLPASTTSLPSAALGTMGGGNLAIDGTDASGTRLDEAVFLMDLAVPAGATPERIGERVHVIFRHGSEVLADQWGRSLRLLLLRQFNA
jgi:putative peptide zinc metalloprotease protein